MGGGVGGTHLISHFLLVKKGGTPPAPPESAPDMDYGRGWGRTSAEDKQRIKQIIKT